MTFYYFVNVTKNISDIAGKTNIKNIGIISLFESVIQANNWNTKDAIMAVPENKKDDHPVIRYSNGDFEFKFRCDDDCDDSCDDSCGIEDEIKRENCTYCGVKLRNHIYGNICKKHVPSYALWDNMPEDYNSNYSAFYEELSERKLAIELDEYDCGQDDDRYNYEDDRYEYDQGLGYEDEGCEESCY